MTLLKPHAPTPEELKRCLDWWYEATAEERMRHRARIMSWWFRLIAKVFTPAHLALVREQDRIDAEQVVSFPERQAPTKYLTHEQSLERLRAAGWLPAAEPAKPPPVKRDRMTAISLDEPPGAPGVAS